ncbi:hypothetical protein BDN70DRAFT_886253 [Pholiota conissans]|uniref:F-box domain-containing protein n=1 Tax=Pholiota conissans TaxID=109636 RepID=A0A9P5YSS7_9AGAR|nr:hypothetical protein BDN70DRAFT_886253 [Pholiota conissans]
MTANIVLSLPEELHIRIMAKLDGRSLIRCAMTCKLLYETLRNSTLLKYRIQLHFDGLEDAGTSTSTTIPEIIDHLLQRRDAWFTQTWADPVYTSGSGTQYRNHRSSYRLGEDGFAVAIQKGNRLEIVWLPTARNAEGRRIEHDLSATPISIYSMDPTQDVIAMLENFYRVPMSQDNVRIVRIYVRTLSGNTPHPLARRSVLQFTDVGTNSVGDSIHNPKLEISHNTLVLWTSDYIPRVLIWDWRTGELLTDVSFIAPCMNPPDDIHDFSLLGSSDFAFMTRPSGCGSIELYKFVKHPIHGTAIQLATLNLPPLARDTPLDSLAIMAYTNPIYAHPSPHKLFVVDREEQIYVFKVEYEYYFKNTEYRRIVTVIMHVHQRIFMKYCARGGGGDKAAVDVPWEEWGPSNTAIDTSIRIRGMSHGQLAICLPIDKQFMNYNAIFTKLEIKNFSLSGVLAAKDAQTIVSLGNHKPHGLLVESNIIRVAEDPIFENDVEGKLPYVLYHLRFEEGYSRMMICEEGVVGIMNTNEGSRLRVYPV